MMNPKARYLLLLIVVTAVFAAGGWGLARFKPRPTSSGESPIAAAPPRASDPDLWARSVEKVKEDRGGTGAGAIEIPAELRHYDERRWFLATQVAEGKKLNLKPVQDFVDLAAMIRSAK